VHGQNVEQRDNARPLGRGGDGGRAQLVGADQGAAPLDQLQLQIRPRYGRDEEKEALGGGHPALLLELEERAVGHVLHGFAHGLGEAQRLWRGWRRGRRFAQKVPDFVDYDSAASERAGPHDRRPVLSQLWCQRQDGIGELPTQRARVFAVVDVDHGLSLALLAPEGRQIRLEAAQVEMVAACLQMHTAFPSQVDRQLPRQLNKTQFVSSFTG